jgi:hypothetical protein
MSESMRQNAGRSRLRFCPKTVARLLPAHSRSGFSRLTAKDISVSTLVDAEVIEQRDQVRVGLFVEDQKAGIDRVGFAYPAVTSTVLVCPPRRRRRLEQGDLMRKIVM